VDDPVEGGKPNNVRAGGVQGLDNVPDTDGAEPEP